MSGDPRIKTAVGIMVAAIVGLCAGGTAWAATPWSNPSGSNPAFGWSGGQNNTDLFGDPVVYPAGFFFHDLANFRADGGGGVGDNATDFARVTVDVAGSTPSGAPDIHFIYVREWGTWSSGISVPTDFLVQADFSVFRYLPAPPGNTGTLTMPVTFYSDGTWRADRQLTAGQAGNPPASNVDWKRFQITVTDTITVKGTAPAGSFIQKAGMDIIVPEPSSALLALAGMLLVLRRPRR